MSKYRTARVAGVVGALAVAGALVAGGTSATADDAARGLTQVIKMKNDKHPRFVAPESVEYGTELQIVNKTDSDKVGPHTFSLVAKEDMPRTKQEMKRCGNLKGVCRKIANDHGVFPDVGDFDVDDTTVDNGSEGWDVHYEGSTRGDSWFAGSEGDTTSRQVLADRKIRFLCIVHPDMQGKVKVENPPMR
jgi:hypothetical protein